MPGGEAAMVCSASQKEWPTMKDRAEEYVRDLAARNVSRREVLAMGAKLGVSLTALGAILSEIDLRAASAASRLEWPETVREPSGPVTISVAHAWEASFWPRQIQFDNDFMKRHPNIVVQAENTPWGSFLTKYLAQAAGGSLPDLMYCHFSWIQRFIKANTVIPLDHYVSSQPGFNLSDFTKPSLVAYHHNGKIYAIPYDEGPGILYYNKDIFDKAKVPYPDQTWTLDHLKQAAQEMTGGSGPTKVFGFNDIPTPGDAAMAPSYLYPFGAAYVNEPQENKYLLDKPEAVAALEWWLDMLKRGLVPSPAEQKAIPSGLSAFDIGRAAMHLDGSWHTPTLNQNAKFRWDVSYWPAGPKRHATFSAGSGYVIAQTSQVKDAAWIYLNEYISTKGEIFMWASTGRGSPSRNSAWPAYIKSKFAPKHAEIIQTSLNTIAIHDILESATATQIVTAAQAVWDLVLIGKMDVPTAVKQIGSQIAPYLQQNM
jgi:multiple sugar transport system substrate-binding protein